MSHAAQTKRWADFGDSLMLLRVLGIVLLSLSYPACSRARTGSIEDPSYSDTTLGRLTKSPGDYDQFHVRVRGVGQIQFEGTTLWVSDDSRSTGRFDGAVWLDVGRPVSDSVAAFNGQEVIVEGRFDASGKGHMGCCQGTLTDIRAIWQPGLESSAFVPHYETRADALDQLEFKTGWVFLGELADDNRWLSLPSFQLVPDSSDTRTTSLRPPHPGDRIRLTERLRIHIIDYATAGEQHRLESPMSRGPRDPSDETRLWLPAGAFVQVEELDMPRAGELRSILARVAPIAQ
jgi:hypothetical protein